MKKQLFFFFGLAFLLCSCSPKPDTLIGHWSAQKVNVQFDETRTTPELVKQIGEMEKRNSFSITEDSILVFKSLHEETQGRVTADAEGNLFLDGVLFGRWDKGQIVTATPSPMGEIVVTYRKD